MAALDMYQLLLLAKEDVALLTRDRIPWKCNTYLKPPESG